MGSALCTGTDPSPRSRGALGRTHQTRTSREEECLPRHKSMQKQLSLRVFLITNAWGCRDPAVPQEALDVTMRTRDSHRHGAESRASLGALLEDVVALWCPQESTVAALERGTHMRGRSFPRPCSDGIGRAHV